MVSTCRKKTLTYGKDRKEREGGRGLGSKIPCKVTPAISHKTASKWSLCAFTNRLMPWWRHIDWETSNSSCQVQSLLWSITANAQPLPILVLACWSYLHWAFLTTWLAQGHWQVDMLIAGSFMCLHYSSLLRRKMPCQGNAFFYLLHYTVRKDEPSHLTASKLQCSVTLTAPSALAGLWTVTSKWKFSLALPKCLALQFPGLLNVLFYK